MPVWGLDKLICAAPFLSFVDPELEELLSIPDLLKEEIMTRYRLFGGVPCHIFDTRHGREVAHQAQILAINSLTADQAERFFKGESEMIEDFSQHNPNSAVMHYNSAVDSLFREYKTIIASDYVYEQVCSRFLSLLWKNLPNDCTGKMFETSP
jgi:hypothetical protein